MKLSKEDINTLLELGYSLGDVEEICGHSRFMRCYIDENVRISRTDASNMLGRKNFLSGFARAMFHQTASRTIPNTDKEISFELKYPY